MRRLELGRVARADLAAIRSYTRQHWDRAQATKYVSQIDTAMRRLATGELSGNSRGVGDYRTQRVDSHLIYYRATKDLLSVVRILHSRMDPGRHLPR